VDPESQNFHRCAYDSRFLEIQSFYLVALLPPCITIVQILFDKKSQKKEPSGQHAGMTACSFVDATNFMIARTISIGGCPWFRHHTLIR
jgi:hypothetical protein